MYVQKKEKNASKPMANALKGIVRDHGKIACVTQTWSCHYLYMNKLVIVKQSCFFLTRPYIIIFVNKS